MLQGTARRHLLVLAALVGVLRPGAARSAHLDCSSSGRCKIVKREVYLRHAPGQRAFSYLLRGDEVEIHSASVNRHHLCITVRKSKFPVLYRKGWIRTSAVCDGDTPCNYPTRPGHCRYSGTPGATNALFLPHHIRQPLTLLMGPGASGRYVVRDRSGNPITANPYVGRLTKATTRYPVIKPERLVMGRDGRKYAWVIRDCRLSPGGWVPWDAIEPSPATSDPALPFECREACCARCKNSDTIFQINPVRRAGEPARSPDTCTRERALAFDRDACPSACTRKAYAFCQNFRHGSLGGMEGAIYDKAWWGSWATFGKCDDEVDSSFLAAAGAERWEPEDDEDDAESDRPECGDGLVNQPEEQCDPPDGGCGSGEVCSERCACVRGEVSPLKGLDPDCGGSELGSSRVVEEADGSVVVSVSLERGARSTSYSIEWVCTQVPQGCHAQSCGVTVIGSLSTDATGEGYFETRLPAGNPYPGRNLHIDVEADGQRNLLASTFTQIPGGAAPTTTTTLPPTCSTPSTAEWICCTNVQQVPGLTFGECGFEIRADPSQLPQLASVCESLFGGAWTAGRCPDPLCGQPAGCCQNQASSCVDVGSIGDGVDLPGAESFCAGLGGSWLSGRCPEPAAALRSGPRLDD